VIDPNERWNKTFSSVKLNSTMVMRRWFSIIQDGVWFRWSWFLWLFSYKCWR